MENYNKEEIVRDMSALKNLILHAIGNFCKKYNGKVVPNIVINKTHEFEQPRGQLMGEEVVKFSLDIKAEILP